jgi:D-cysteine desulfhydrase
MTILFDHYPELHERLPWEHLVSVPTPTEPAPALGPDVWVKRDDLTAAPYGGNKVRKLEFLLADARARGRRAVLTVGAAGSNHVLATGIYARALGFTATHAVLVPQPASDDVAKKRAAYGAQGIATSRVAATALAPFGLLARTTLALARGQGVPYAIGPGGSSPLGVLGYVAAGLELAAQVHAGVCPAPAEVWVPAGSCGTAAGLLVGLRLAALDARLCAVAVAPGPFVSARRIARLADAASALLVARGVALPPRARRFTASDVVFEAGEVGRGYGHETPAARAACARAADAGLALDTTYSGKALAAMLARRSGAAPVLFWLTYSSLPGGA